MMPSRFHGWLPIRVFHHDRQIMIDWGYIGERRLTEPFFEQTVDAALRQPFNLLFRRQTPIDLLDEFNSEQSELSPNGFIFHMSRCGSTLIAQLLATLPGMVVLAEAAPIDAMLRVRDHDPLITDDQRCRWLRGMINALGRPRRGDETALVVKFDSWSILDLPLIHRAFPHVPWIFVFRDPVEVLVSHYHERGSQMVPSIINPALFGFDRAVLQHMSLDHYAARVLARICAAAVEHRALGSSYFVPYSQLPDAVWAALLHVFNVPHVQSDLDRMWAATRFHAKRPTEHFVQDAAAKQRNAPAALREAAASYVEPLYDQLLALLPTHGLSR